jgi:hypothetical protein
MVVLFGGFLELWVEGSVVLAGVGEVENRAFF